MIKIGDNRDNRFEFNGTLLEKSKENYITIPLSLILNDEMDSRRVAVFSYLRCCCGIDGICRFTIPSLVTWFGGKPDKRTDGVNGKVLNTIDDLNDMGYLTYLTKPSKSSYIECEFDFKKYNDEHTGGFATLYLDEINKILNYKKQNSKDSQLINTTILLVFAYLRAKIHRRKNELKPELRNEEGIKKRKLKNPEAYNGLLMNIADDIGISEKTLTKAIDILETELELIVTERAYRIKNNEGEFRTLHTIFANSYKREGKNLLAAGEEYSREEIKIKADFLRNHYGWDFTINKEKRKTRKGAN